MVRGKYVFLESTHSVGLMGGSMETRVTLKPGSKGTKKLVTRFGERLVCVRYRYDAANRIRYKTVELVIEQLPWNPGRRKDSAPGRPPVLVGIPVRFEEVELRKRVKEAGGRWLPDMRLWVLPLGVAKSLGLAERAVAVPDLPATKPATTDSNLGG